MAYEIRLERKIKASKEFVFEWWTDFSPEDNQLVKPLKTRKIISSSPTVILLHDEEEMYFRKMQFEVKVTLDKPNFRWIAEYEGKIARATSEYVLVDDVEKQARSSSHTVLSYRSVIEPIGFFTKLFSSIVKPFVKRVFSGEMKVFIETLEREYREKLEKEEHPGRTQNNSVIT